MEFLLKLLSVLMVILLITVQFMFLLPCGADFGTDGLNGEPIKSYQSIIGQGYATMNLLGSMPQTAPHINGRHIMVIQRFPLS